MMNRSSFISVLLFIDCIFSRLTASNLSLSSFCICTWLLLSTSLMSCNLFPSSVHVHELLLFLHLKDFSSNFNFWVWQSIVIGLWSLSYIYSSVFSLLSFFAFTVPFYYCYFVFENHCIFSLLFRNSRVHERIV